MRNPDSTKNTSTPRNPPGKAPAPGRSTSSMWPRTTRPMARARTPSRAGCRPSRRRCTAGGAGASGISGRYLGRSSRGPTTPSGRGARRPAADRAEANAASLNGFAAARSTARSGGSSSRPPHRVDQPAPVQGRVEGARSRRCGRCRARPRRPAPPRGRPRRGPRPSRCRSPPPRGRAARGPTRGARTLVASSTQPTSSTVGPASASSRARSGPSPITTRRMPSWLATSMARSTRL